MSESKSFQFAQTLMDKNWVDDLSKYADSHLQEIRVRNTSYLTFSIK